MVAAGSSDFSPAAAGAASRPPGIEDSVWGWLARFSQRGPRLSAVARNADSSARAPWRLAGRAYDGRLASVLELECHGLISLQLEAGPDSFLLLLNSQGLLEGSCGERPIAQRRDRLMGGLLPGERLALSSRNPFGQQLWLHLPFELVAETLQQSGRPCLPASLIQQFPEGFGSALRPLLVSLLAGAAESSDQSSQWWLQRLEATVFSTLLQLVAMAPEQAGGNAGLSQNEELHEQAAAFMRSHLAEPLDLDAIARACACSPRTLQLAFRKHRQQTPMQVLRALRLEAMREALLRGEKVCDASRKSGLTISGKLSSLYRDAFGESPNQTLRNGRGKSGFGEALAESAPQSPAPEAD